MNDVSLLVLLNHSHFIIHFWDTFLFHCSYIFPFIFYSCLQWQAPGKDFLEAIFPEAAVLIFSTVPENAWGIKMLTTFRRHQQYFPCCQNQNPLPNPKWQMKVAELVTKTRLGCCRKVSQKTAVANDFHVTATWINSFSWALRLAQGNLYLYYLT